MKIVTLVRVAALVAPFSLFGVCIADTVVEKPVAANTPETFADAAQGIRTQMEAGGRYQYISATDKAQVNVDLTTMATLLQKAGSVASMPDADRLKLFNTQEHVNGLLVHNDKNRLVCTHEAHIGSNLPTTFCKTVESIEIARRESQLYTRDSMDRSNPYSVQSKVGSAPVGSIGGQ